MSVLDGKDAWKEISWEKEVVAVSPVKSNERLAPPSKTGSSPPCPPPMPPPPSYTLSSNVKLKLSQSLVPTVTHLSLVPVVILQSAAEDCPGSDSSSGSGSDSDSDARSPPAFSNIQEKIDVFDKAAETSKFYRKRTDSVKRKHSDSSDKREITKAEKRSLKKEKKKIRKQEYQRRDLLKITSNGN